MKANVLMDQLFDIDSGEICGVVDDVIELSEKSAESIKDLTLQFWYQQAFTVYMVCCDLAEASTHFINC